MKSKLASVRVLVIAAAFAVLATGCGGGGGATGGGVAPTASTLVPPADIAAPGKPVNPTAAINAQSADTLAKMVMAAMDSLVKTSVMYGIFSMNDPWPMNNGGTVSCVNGGDVLWVDADVTSALNQLVSKNSKGKVTYTSCDSGTVGSLNGSVNLTYTSSSPSQTDFAVDMDAVSVSGAQYSQYSPQPFVFTGAYIFNQSTAAHAPVYAVPTGVSFGTQRIIGQPVLQHISNADTSIQFDGNNVQGYSPTPVLVRSNLDASGAWVELQFGRWDVDYSTGKMLPAATCDAVNPCTVTITAANGDRATINVTQAGRAQTMIITPNGGGSPSTVAITF